MDLTELRQLHPDITLADYLELGGFPEPVLAGEDADRLLRQYFHDIAECDVREQVSARSSLPVRQVAQIAYELAGTELNLRRVAAATGLTVDAVQNCLEACERAYLLFAVPSFASAAPRQANRQIKYYPIDPGLRRVVVSTGSEDRGKSLECAVYLALRRRFRDIYYWRNGGEVDFVIERNGRPTPIQVTWDEPQERHHRALDAFYERFPRADEAVFITADTFETEVAALTADSQ